jgi:hypothetical protein
MEEARRIIHTWQKRASSSVQVGGWLNTYRATTCTNTAIVSTAKRVTIVISTDRRIGRKNRSAAPVDNDLGADLDRTDVIFDIHIS